MLKIEKVLHTGRTHTVGGREGTARSDDGRLELILSPPGAPGNGTNPEQLFAAAWSASFIGALRQAGRARKIEFPVDTSVDAELELGHAEHGFFLRARFFVSMPGIGHDVGHALVDAAHHTCPYSKATLGNIQIATELV